MSLILNIETAVTTASVCLAQGTQVLGLKANPSQKDSAAWLHVAIQELLAEAGVAIRQLAAVAVSAGPGSYTGLRVGMAAAKGLCYALGCPLITINTLKIMTVAAEWGSGSFCPMIDARRMEVFTAVYDQHLTEIKPSHNLILSLESFSDLLKEHHIIFFGNGSYKFGTLITQANASFIEVEATAEHMVTLSYEQFLEKQFADVAYSTPDYGKDFYSPSLNNSA